MSQSVFEVILEDVEKNPDDPVNYGILADYCQDLGEREKAECLYWMVQNKKRPYHQGCEPKNDRPVQASWFNAGAVSEGLGDPGSDLPAWLYDGLDGKVLANHKNFSSVREAVLAVIAVWCSPTARGAREKEAGEVAAA